MKRVEAEDFARYLERRLVGQAIEAVKLLPIQIGDTWILHVVRLKVREEQILPGQIPDFGKEPKL